MRGLALVSKRTREDRSLVSEVSLKVCRGTYRLLDLNTFMRVAKGISVSALSLVMMAGLLCSHICAFTCSLNGCSKSTTARAPAASNAHSHCHQQQNNTPQRNNNSSPCTGHFDAVALGASSRISSYTSPQLASTEAVIIQSSLLFLTSPLGSGVQSGGKPDRSPPVHSVLRI